MKRKVTGGQRFGHRAVISGDYVYPYKGGKARVACRCDCGSIALVEVRALLDGRCLSCLMCAQGPLNPARTHGATGSGEFRAWHSMQQRCAGKTNRAHVYEGLPIDPRWLGEDGFLNFLADMGPKPSKRHSLDRKDGTKGYSPDNCQWATPKQQARNRSNTAMLTAHGQTMPLVAWAERTGIPYWRLRRRVALGWTPEQVIDGRPPASRWASRPRIKYRIDGVTRTLVEWAQIAGVSRGTFLARVKAGMTPKEALERGPVRR